MGLAQMIIIHLMHIHLMQENPHSKDEKGHHQVNVTPQSSRSMFPFPYKVTDVCSFRLCLSAKHSANPNTSTVPSWTKLLPLAAFDNIPTVDISYIHTILLMHNCISEAVPWSLKATKKCRTNPFLQRTALSISGLHLFSLFSSAPYLYALVILPLLMAPTIASLLYSTKCNQIHLFS